MFMASPLLYVLSGLGSCLGVACCSGFKTAMEQLSKVRARVTAPAGISRLYTPFTSPELPPHRCTRPRHAPHTWP